MNRPRLTKTGGLSRNSASERKEESVPDREMYRYNSLKARESWKVGRMYRSFMCLDQSGEQGGGAGETGVGVSSGPLM